MGRERAESVIFSFTTPLAMKSNPHPWPWIRRVDLAGVWRTQRARSLGADGAQALGMVGGDCGAPAAGSEQLACPSNSSATAVSSCSLRGG